MLCLIEVQLNSNGKMIVASIIYTNWYPVLPEAYYMVTQRSSFVNKGVKEP